MFSNPPSPTTNSDSRLEPPYYQQLMFLPAGQDREKYNPKEYRTLLSKHLHDRSKKAKKPQRRPLDAGQAEAGASGGGTAP